MSSNTPKTILVLTANPKGTTQLRLDEEVREIDAGLQRARQRDQFVLKQKWAVRSRDIQRAMLDSEPSIVHFSGHGTGDEGLVFEDETGIAKLVDGESLAGLFELFAEQVECVVLNGCYSEVQATAIARHVNYVIGMNKALGDRAAIEFAVGFYDALGAGRPVEIAHKFGCAAIRLAGILEYLTPVLKKKPGIEAGNVVQEAKQGVPTNQTALSNVEVGGNIKLSVPATPQFTPDRIILSSQDRSPVPPKLAEEIEDITSIQEQEQATFRDIASRRPVTPPPPFPQLNPGSTLERTPLRINRNQFLKWAGFGSAGLVTAVVTRNIFQFSGFSPKPISQQNFKFDVVTVDERGKEINRRPSQAQFFTEDLGNGVTLEMVAIPGGKFIMGSPVGEGDDTERPQHEVTVQPFFMGKFQVTQAQWKAVANNLPRVKRDLKANPSMFEGDDRPVERVSWYDAVEFCDRLSTHTNRQYRLPSEAEWEYACRAGTTTPFHFGETITDKLANYNASGKAYASETSERYRNETTVVGSFSSPNPFGLHDMHGNVREWCADTWHNNYDNAPTDGSAWTSDGNDNRSPLRGGSWFTGPENCRSADRHSANLRRDGIEHYMGFRVVCGVGRTQ